MIGYCVVVFHCVVLFCFEVDFFVESCFVEDGSVGLDCNVLPISCNVDCVVFCCSVYDPLCCDMVLFDRLCRIGHLAGSVFMYGIVLFGCRE